MRVRDRTSLSLTWDLRCCAPPKGDTQADGLICVLLFKKQIRDWLLKKLESYSWPCSLKQRIRETVDNVVTMRANMGFAADPLQYENHFYSFETKVFLTLQY